MERIKAFLSISRRSEMSVYFFTQMKGESKNE